MTEFPNEILKACDIRGICPRPLGTKQAEQIGLAAGTLVKEETHRNIKVVVGHDVRNHSESLNKALVNGLQHTGLKIVDAGEVSTPLLSYATQMANAAVGIMITASHNPSEYNGFKFFLPNGPVSPRWMERLYGILHKQSFRKGAGVVEKKDFYADYRNALVNTVAQNFQGFRMVVDVGNGAGALTVPGVLKALNCDVDLMNGKPDGDFPGRGADSSRPEALKALGERVRKVKAQLGVAFDGDGDRVSFTDEKGREVPNDLILCLFAEDMLKKIKNLKVVYDGKCSDWAEKRIQECGGIPVLEKSGHSFIFNRMQSERAALGGEASGHFFLPGSFMGDALFACLRLLGIMKESGKGLGQYFEQFPARVSTHDIKLDVAADQLPHLFEDLKKRAQEAGAKVSTLDGVRAVFEGGWGIIRMSVTEAVLTCRFEAATHPQLRKTIETWLEGRPDIQKTILIKSGLVQG